MIATIRNEIMEILRGNRVIDARAYFAMAGVGLFINEMWFKKYEKLNDSWSDKCQEMNNSWYKLCDNLNNSWEKDFKKLAEKAKCMAAGEVDLKNYTEKEIEERFVAEVLAKLEEDR